MYMKIIGIILENGINIFENGQSINRGDFMKKERSYTIVFVLSSILSITAMLFSMNNKVVVNENTINPILSVEKENIEEESVTMDSESKDSKNIDNDILIDEINENDKESKNNDNDSEIMDKENNRFNKNIDNTTVDDNAENEEAPVFKVASSKILGSLSILDKEKLLVIGTKLAPLDYARIKEYLYSDDRDKGVKNVILLLKERLSDKDYEKVKKIMDEYINIDSIEKDDKN